MRKLLSTAVAIGIFTSTSLLPVAYADVLPGTLPVINDKSSNVDITKNGTNMNIKITGGQGAIGNAEWKSFDIAGDSSVNIQFTNHHQTSFNKVMAGSASEIYGKLTDNTLCNCTYNETGKIILLNPNGIIFGNNSVVDVNSFTASTLGGSSSKYGEYSDVLGNGAGTLTLRSTGTSEHGIKVLDGATIKGAKNVTLASDKILTYEGSKILTTQTDANGNVAAGQVKLVTSDGVNFQYSNWGANAVKSTTSSDKSMTLALNGQIHSGSIEAINASAGDLNINGSDAILKVYRATKAVQAVDGNINLVADNTITIDNNADISIENKNDWTNGNGSVSMTAGNNLSVKNSKVSTLSNRTTDNKLGNVNLTSKNGNVLVNKSTITSDKDINVNASKLASIQTLDGTASTDGSTLTASNGTINVTGGTTAQVQKSTLNAKDIVVKGGNVYTASNAKLNASNNIDVTAQTGIASFKDTTNTAGNKITITSVADSLKFNNTTNNANTVEATSYNAIAYNNTSSSNVINESDKTFNADNVSLKSTNSNVILNNKNPYAQFKDNANITLTAAKDVDVVKTEGDLEVKNLTLSADKNILLKSADGNLKVNGNTTKITKADVISLEAKNGGVTTEGTFDVNKNKTQIISDNAINVTLKNVDNPEKGLIATNNSGNITINAKDSSDNSGKLAVAKIISANDLIINASKIVKGKGYDLAENKNGYYPTPKKGGFDDDTDRGYIEVGANNDNNAKLTINGTEFDYKTKLDGNDGERDSEGYIKAHHIDLGSDGSDSLAGKIYLVQKVKENTGKSDPVNVNDNTKGTEGIAANLGGDSGNDVNAEDIGSSRGGADINTGSGSGNGGSQGGSQGGNPSSGADCDDNRENETPII